jgi:hypothetical protein
MKLSEYKESGILEAYVLGVLDPERSSQLETDLETNVALRRELNETEQRLANFKKNFTRSKKGKNPKPVDSARTAKKSALGRRIVTGILILIVIGLTFLFLSTLYQSAAYHAEVIEVSEQLAMTTEEKEILGTERHALENSLWKLMEERESVVILRSGTGFSGAEGYILKMDEIDRFTLLLNNIPTIEEGNYLQLWGRSGETWRRMGMIHASEVNEAEGRTVYLFPQPNLRLEMITEEFESAPESPNRSRVVLRR